MSPFVAAIAVLGALSAAAPASATVVFAGTYDQDTKQKSKDTATVKSTCGTIADFANAKDSRRISINKSWHPDQWKNVQDPELEDATVADVTSTAKDSKNKKNKNYGNHMTIALYESNLWKGTCHIYESGAVYCTNPPANAHIASYLCNLP